MVASTSYIFKSTVFIKTLIKQIKDKEKVTNMITCLFKQGGYARDHLICVFKPATSRYSTTSLSFSLLDFSRPAMQKYHGQFLGLTCDWSEKATSFPAVLYSLFQLNKSSEHS